MRSPSLPCSRRAVCVISRAESTRSGRLHFYLLSTPHAPSSGGPSGPHTRSCTGGRGRTAAACCTGGPTSTPMARASGSTWVRPRWADASPTGCSPIPSSCPPAIPTTSRCCAAPRATTASWTSRWSRTSRSFPVASPIPVSWRRDRRISSARWSGAGARSYPYGAATPGAIARTAPRPPRRSSRATARPSWLPGPRSCSRCGTKRPSRATAARPTGSSDVVQVPHGAARRLAHDGREWPAVDLPDGSALVLARDVPALGYLALTESERAANPPRDDGPALEAQAGSFHVVLDPASGAIRSLTTGDRVERVRPAGGPGGPGGPGAGGGLNQLLYVQGGARRGPWAGRGRRRLQHRPHLTVRQPRLTSARRLRPPRNGAR